MNESLLALAKDAFASLRDLLPIVLGIGIFQIFVIRGSISSVASRRLP